jgi:ABC-2 type transport system permease protein
MSIFLSLATLYIRSFYNLPGRKAPGTKTTGKEILKFVGMGFLVVLVVANMGYLFVMMNLNLYQGLVMAGLQGMLLLNASVMATMLTLVIGFMTSLSTYYLNDMELQLLSMPIKPRALFSAKFVAVYMTEAAISLFFMVATMVIFGSKENPHPLFYVYGTIAGLLLPLPALAASYLIQIPLLSFARFLRNKRTIMIVGGIVGIVFGLAFNMYFQRMMPPTANPTARAATFAGPDSIIARMGRSYPPALYAWRAMANPASSTGFFAMLQLFAACVIGPALVMLLLSGTYAKSLIGFNESHIKKLTRDGANAFIARRLRQGRPFVTMVRREFDMMNREPMYLLNGPFIVVMLPLIMGIMYVVQKDALFSDPDLAGVMALVDGGFGVVLAGLAGAFMGSSTSIASTAVSRDAKALPFIKSLPIKPGTYLLAKLGHALIFGVLGSAIGVGLIAFLMKMRLVDALAGFAVALSLSSLLNLAGLWLDTANPRLTWDNPIAAMKQNPNSLVAMLGSMGLLGGAGYLAFRFALNPGAFALWFGAVPALLFAVLLVPFPKFAEKRLGAMEG